MPVDVGVSIPYQETHPRSSGRAFSDHTIEESDDAFIANLIVQFQGQWVTGQDDFFKCIMPITYYKGNGLMIKIKTYQIKAVAYDPRPLGVSAQSTVQSAQEYMVTMTRWGLRIKYNTDSIQTPEGMQAFKERLVQYKAAAINTMMSHGMDAINRAAFQDPLAELNLQFQKQEAQTIQNLNTKYHRDLVGCINNSTGALKRAITSFNTIFAYYSGMTKYILMCPETYAMLQNRPWAPDIPEFAVEGITRNRKVATGGGRAPSGHPDVDCIIIPQLPRNSAGKMYSPLERRVYASTYMYFESPVPNPSMAFKNTSLSVYDIDLDSKTNLTATAIMNADPMLQKAVNVDNFDHNDFANKNVPDEGKMFVLAKNGLNNVVNYTDDARIPDFGNYMGGDMVNLIEGFNAYAASQTWQRQREDLPATTSPWGTSINAILSWQRNPLRRTLLSATDPNITIQINGNAPRRLQDLFKIHATVYDTIIHDKAIASLNGGVFFGADAYATNAERERFGVAIMWMEILYTIHTLRPDVFNRHADTFAKFRAPHFLFLRETTKEACFSRLRAEPDAQTMQANWAAQTPATKAISPSPYITISDYLSTVGQSFDTMIHTFKRMSWSPVPYIVVKPANVAVGYRMVFTTGQIGQIFVRLDGTFEGLDVASNMGDVETAMHCGAAVTRRQEVGFLDNGHVKMEGPTIAHRLPETGADLKSFAAQLRILIKGPNVRTIKNTPTLMAVPVCGHATGENKLEVQFYSGIAEARKDVEKRCSHQNTVSVETECTLNASLYLAYAGFLAPYGSKGAEGTCGTLDNFLDDQDEEAPGNTTFCITRFRNPQGGAYQYYLEPFTHSTYVGSSEAIQRDGNCCFGIIKDKNTGTFRSGGLGSGGGELAPTIQAIRVQ